MGKRFHGVTSLLLTACAVLIALWALWQMGMVYVLAYGVTLVVGGVAILAAYCAKCPCSRHGCAHVLPGLLCRILPERTPSPYQAWEKGAVFIALALIIGIPQWGLRHHLPALAAFWVLMGTAFIQIRLKVCRSCQNHFCTLKNS